MKLALALAVLYALAAPVVAGPPAQPSQTSDVRVQAAALLVLPITSAGPRPAP